MSLNSTIDYLIAKKSISLLVFARQLSNTSVLLYGPGQLDSVGIPLPCNGVLRRLTIYEGTNVYNCDSIAAVSSGDLISVRADFGSTSFTITVTIGGSLTTLTIPGVGGYRTVWASVLVELLDPVIG